MRGVMFALTLFFFVKRVLRGIHDANVKSMACHPLTAAERERLMLTDAEVADIDEYLEKETTHA